jgi:hypothetical protein
MDERGESSPRAAQAAAVDTRKAKDYDVDLHDVALELRARIADKGLGPGELADIVDRQGLERPTRGELVQLARGLLGPEGMTEHRSTFSRRDAIQRWATLHHHGESAERIVALADRWLAQREVVALEPESGTPGGLGDQLPLVLPDRRDFPKSPPIAAIPLGSWQQWRPATAE